MINDRKDALLFNGQVYRHDSGSIPISQSDTSYIFERLESCDNHDQIVDVFTGIDGPFAFIYWHQDTSTLFYGRDIFGRKSLCVLRNKKTSQILLISSVATFPNEANHPDLAWEEADPLSFVALDYRGLNFPKRVEYRWTIDKLYPEVHSPADSSTSSFNISTPYISPLNLDCRPCRDFDETDWRRAIHEVNQVLVASVSKHVERNKGACLSCRKNLGSSDGAPDSKCEHSKVAVAFSGGIDSTLLAYALDRVLEKCETIDLVSVAFEQGAPDRASVEEAFDELRNLKPSRNWRLVLCDISIEELKAMRRARIRDLISPCITVIDDSLGCATWFIGRARGRSIDSRSLKGVSRNALSPFMEYTLDYRDYPGLEVNHDYTSCASMMFVGSAIDEQLGGYSSHRSSWSKSGEKGLLNEISYQMRRLPTRNLGRDDRNYSDHGRDLKLPYLDSELVSLLNRLPIGLKMDLDLPISIGPKKILRDLASDWGLIHTSQRVKRAMQFGTRIANLECNKEKGSEVCDRLLSDNEVAV